MFQTHPATHTHFCTHVCKCYNLISQDTDVAHTSFSEHGKIFGPRNGRSSIEWLVEHVSTNHWRYWIETTIPEWILSFLVSISQTSAPHYIIFQLVSASETRLTLYHFRMLTPLTRSDIYGLNIHDKRSHFHHKRSKNPKDLFVPDLQRSLLAHSILRFNQLSIGY